MGGAGGDDTITGSKFDDLLGAFDDDPASDTGNDVVSGEGGNDTLGGGLGADILNGGDGDDGMIGNGGPDTLTGGPGDDAFYFAATSDSPKKKALRDTITDFEAKADKIDLSFIDANVGKDGDQKFKFVKKEGGAFKNKPGSVIWEQIDKHGAAKDMTVIYADTNGDHKADMAIQLKGLIHLHHSDFVL